MPHRYYYDGALKEGSSIYLSREEEKHLKNVMRTKKGTEIEIINGQGLLATAIYEDTLIIEQVTRSAPFAQKKSLALALTEPKTLELVIEKCTEIGIDSFLIFPAIKSKLKCLSENKKERLNKILISSIKQSKRLFLPTISYLNKKEDLLSDESYLLADFNGGPFLKNTRSHTFIIGPESGFTKDEIAYFINNLSAQSLLLSDGVLRTETAAICAAHLLSL